MGRKVYVILCFGCGKELTVRSAIFYEGRVYCLGCRRALKHKKQ